MSASHTHASQDRHDEWPDQAVIALWGRGDSLESRYAEPNELRDVEFSDDAQAQESPTTH